jgi:hypothetical protein
MELIPLRNSAVLYKYERVISDPLFKEVKLLKSSVADRALVERVRLGTPSLSENESSTSEYMQLLFFLHCTRGIRELSIDFGRSKEHRDPYIREAHRATVFPNSKHHVPNTPQSKHPSQNPL